MSVNYDQSAIEDILKGMVQKAGISENIFKGSRPKTIEKTMNDFVVVKLTGSVSDMAAYGRTTCSIDLYVRNIAEEKNGNRLSVMFRKVDSLLPRQEGTLLLNEPRTIADVPDGYGFTVRMINISTIIEN